MHDSAQFLNPLPAAKRAERVATDTLEVCLNTLGLDRVPLPVPVEEWIEHPLGYEFGVEDLSVLGEGVLGASYMDERRIVVDQSVMSNDGRFRFTAAHELGHMLLHGTQRAGGSDSLQLLRDRDAKLERQADRFAAAFLMPLSLVVRSLVEICAEARLDQRTCIVELMTGSAEGEWLWRHRFLPRLTRKFGVSRSTAINRFLDIRLREDRQSFMPRQIAVRLRQRESPDAPSFHIVEGKPVLDESAQTKETLF